jgi:hypothetical protein
MLCCYCHSSAQPGPDTRVVIPFLTHFADLSSWEYAQKLNQKVLPQLREQGLQVKQQMPAMLHAALAPCSCRC